MSKRMPIGEFARLSRLSVKALRHYDALGLLKPSAVDALTGYRSYALEQAAQAERIQMLRAIELPLSEVGQLLSSAPAVQLAILEAHRARLVESATRTAEQLEAVDRLRSAWNGSGADVSVKSVPALKVISRRASLSTEEIGPFVSSAVIALAQAVFGSGGQVTGPAMTLYPESPLEDAVDLEVALPVDRPPPGFPTRELREERVACAVHRGHYVDLPHTYRRLLEWLESSQLSPCGPWRELYLVSPATAQRAEDFRTEVQLPVE